MRKRGIALLGLLIAVVGAVFTLQGFGVLGGSFMSGSATWAVIGLVMVAAGISVYGYATRAP